MELSNVLRFPRRRPQTLEEADAAGTREPGPPWWKMVFGAPFAFVVLLGTLAVAICYLLGAVIFGERQTEWVDLTTNTLAGFVIFSAFGAAILWLLSLAFA